MCSPGLSWSLDGCLDVRRLHAHHAQHQIDLTTVADFILLDTMDKNLLS